MLIRMALRDLQWRRRRLLIATVAAALVFAITFLLSGLSHGFGVEAEREIETMGADGWVVKAGSAGPFLGQTPFPAHTLDAVASAPGITAATPVVFTRTTVGADKVAEVNVRGGSGPASQLPALAEGRAPRSTGEIVVSDRLSYDVGDTLTLAGREFAVVGRIDDWTALAGVPNVALTLADAQQVAFAGLEVLSAIAVTGATDALPADFELIDRDTARDDLLRPTAPARSTISLFAVLDWLIAIAIVASVTYLSALERSRDFAVLRATGTTVYRLAGDLALQATVVSMMAAGLGALIATAMASQFALPVVIPGALYLMLPLLGLGVGLIASMGAMRYAVRVDPALAFSSG